MTQSELFNKRIIKVIPRNSSQPPTTFYAVADSDLVERRLMQTDTNEMIEVVPYYLRNDRDLVYVAAMKDLVLISKDGYVPNFRECVAKDERQAYYSVLVMKTKLLSKISPFDNALTPEQQYRYVPIFAIIMGWNKPLFESVLKRMDRSSLLKKMSHTVSEECEGDTVLHQIVRYSRIEFFRSLVKIRPELMRSLANVIGNAGMIPLHRAVINDNAEMIDTLLTYTRLSSIRKSRDDSSTMLDDALLKGNDKMAMTILDDDYLREEVVKHSPELLHNAAKRPYSIFKPVFEAFVSAGHSVTTLQCGISFFTLMIQLRNSDCVIQLMDNPAFDPSLLTEPDLHGNTPLHWAATDGLYVVCSKLYPIYADLGLLLATNDKGQTALALAARGNTWYGPLVSRVNHEATVALLISDPVVGDELISIDDNNSCSPLYLALTHKASAEICEMLYDRMDSEQVCRQYASYRYSILNLAICRRMTVLIDVVLKDIAKSRCLLTLRDAEGLIALQFAKEFSPAMYSHLKQAIQAF